MDDIRPGSFTGQIGERWVVRRGLADGSATDVTGWVEQVSPQCLVLRTREGADVSLPWRSVLAARRVSVAYGGRDPMRTSAEELEQLAARAWVADWETLGAWTLRSGGGFTGRANSCLAVGDPGLPLELALDRVVTHAAEHGIPVRVQVVEGSDEERALRRLGWVETYVRTAVLVVRLSTWLGEEALDGQVEVAEEWTPAWEEAYHRSRPSAADPALVRWILTSAPPRAFAGLPHGGRLVSIGRGQVARDWVGFSAVWTDPEHRGHGMATRVMRSLGHWAARLGARSGYVQVEAENEAALRTYERLGFLPHHRYLYLAPEGQTGA